MKKISLLLVILHPLNSLALNIRPEDLYDYDFGEQPDLEEVLIHIGLSIMFALLMYGSVAIQKKARNKIISRVGSIIAFICILGSAYNFLPCIATFWFWIIGVGIVVVAVIVGLIVQNIMRIHDRKCHKPYKLDKGDYIFVGYVDSKSFKEYGECPKSSFIGISKATRDSIYTKDGTCYYDWCGKFLPIEENPYYGDTAIGEWGTYRYRYKVVYDNKKYCQQGWCYHYFNF